jgi:putative YjhG/YagF family dehydratase
MTTLEQLLNTTPAMLEVKTKAPGMQGKLPLTHEMLLESPSGDLFGLTQNAGMGWKPSEMLGQQVLLLSTQGGMRAEDGSPIALGYHTGHWEVGLLMRAAAETLRSSGAVPFAGYVSDPCDGRTQGTTGMMDSLPYRNDAAIVFRRLIRSLPTRQAVIGIATCDKGLPAMLMALAGSLELPTVIVPGGVTLPPEDGEDAGKIQTIGVRYANGEITLEAASELGCRACATAGGGCQFLGTAASSQVLAEVLGLTVPHAALAPSGQAIWLEMARASARAVLGMLETGINTKNILTPDAIHNAMVVHAAFGGSTNMLLHIPAIAHAAKLKRPTVQDWIAVNARVPRLVDALPNGPKNHTTVQVFLAGGVPEVMLHLRDLGLLKLEVLTVTGKTLGQNLEWWETSERRRTLRQVLQDQDKVDPNDVILSPSSAKARGITSTVTFPTGNIAPLGSVVKSTAIDPSVIDADGVYRKLGQARVFTRERDAINAIKGRKNLEPIKPDDVIVLICGGPMGTGMEETYQVTSALKHLSWGKEVAVITDARFSGVSTGACIGHVSPEALAGGAIGRIQDGDLLEIMIDCHNLRGTINFVGTIEARVESVEGARILELRESRADLEPHPLLPDDTKIWAALQHASGGVWGGCVYDAQAIGNALGFVLK